MRIIEKVLLTLVCLALAVMIVGLVMYQAADSGIVANNGLKEIGMWMMIWSIVGGLVSGVTLIKV